MRHSSQVRIAYAVPAPRCRSAGLQGSGVEGVDLCSAFGSEGGMLFDGMRMKAVDPEHRMVQAVTDTVGTHVFGDLCDPSHPERT
jgi:hypothetical protein